MCYDTYYIPFCEGCQIFLDESDEVELYRDAEGRMRVWASGDFKGQALHYHDHPLCGAFVYEIPCMRDEHGEWRPEEEFADYDYPPWPPF